MSVLPSRFSPIHTLHHFPIRCCPSYDSLDAQSAYQLIHTELQQPAVFSNMVEHWQYRRDWTPKHLSEIFGGKTTKFRMLPRMSNEVVWETDCQFVDASFSEFDRWINGDQGLEETDDNGMPSSSKYPRTDNKLLDLPKLSDFNPETYAAYADYKYMKDLFLELPGYKQGIDWSTFGLPELTGEQSTFWMGTEGAYTPCHYDTYGFNLVTQLHGRKKWMLFSPHQTDCLYPTRLPYEESSVFSQVNIKRPDFNKHPCFKSAEPFEV